MILFWMATQSWKKRYNGIFPFFFCHKNSVSCVYKCLDPENFNPNTVVMLVNHLLFGVSYNHFSYALLTCSI